MSGTNAYCLFEYEEFGKFDFADMPKNVFFALAVNPYNGGAMLKYNRSAESLVVIDDILAQIQRKISQIEFVLDRKAGIIDFIDVCDGRLELGTFDPCPFCGKEPDYRTYDDPCDGVIVCCDGRTRITGFDDRIQAVRFWNDRARRVA